MDAGAGVRLWVFVNDSRNNVRIIESRNKREKNKKNIIIKHNSNNLMMLW